MARKTTASKRPRRHADSRMCVRTQRMRKMNAVAFYILLIAVCCGVIAKCLPELKALQNSEKELAALKADEVAVNERADQQMRKYRALEQDPSFLEIYGRDRLDLYREGESVFRFSRGE